MRIHVIASVAPQGYCVRMFMPILRCVVAIQSFRCKSDEFLVATIQKRLVLFNPSVVLAAAQAAWAPLAEQHQTGREPASVMGDCTASAEPVKEDAECAARMSSTKRWWHWSV